MVQLPQVRSLLIGPYPSYGLCKGDSKIADGLRTVGVVGTDKAKLKEQARIKKIVPMAMRVERIQEAVKTQEPTFMPWPSRKKRITRRRTQVGYHTLLVLH
jgi:hypothetical protein